VIDTSQQFIFNKKTHLESVAIYTKGINKVIRYCEGTINTSKALVAVSRCFPFFIILVLLGQS